jgi:hypothetical protein
VFFSVLFSGWFLVNIIAPLALPILGLLVLKLLPLPGPSDNLRIMTTVKDGQLCWAVVAMSAATIYELWTAFEANKHLPGWRDLALATTILIMLPAMLLAAGGAVFSTPLLPAGSAPADDFKTWVVHYRVFVASAVLVFGAAFILTGLHFSIGD